MDGTYIALLGFRNSKTKSNLQSSACLRFALRIYYKVKSSLSTLVACCPNLITLLQRIQAFRAPEQCECSAASTAVFALGVYSQRTPENIWFGS